MVKNGPNATPRVLPRGSYRITPIIPRDANQLLRHLSDLRARLLSNKRVVNRIMSEKGLKGKVASTERSIKNFDSEHGRLVIKPPLTGVDLVLVWGSEAARKIKEVIPRDVALRFREEEFSEVRKKFEKVFSVECPLELLVLYDIYDKLENLFGPGSGLWGAVESDAILSSLHGVFRSGCCTEGSQKMHLYITNTPIFHGTA